MNRYKKEEKKRGKPYPSETLSERDYNELINAHKEKRKPVFKDLKKKSKKKS